MPQLVVTGDFFQLPPVVHNREIVFAFEAVAWLQCFPGTTVLRETFRQKDSCKSGCLGPFMSPS